jgi:hypothetical protein
MSFGSIIQSGDGLSYPTVRPKFDLNLIRNRSIPPEYSYTRNSSGTYVGSDGLIKTAAINEPRFDYDPVTGEYKGLLIEESRTNVITQSENTETYTASNATISTEILNGPFGIKPYAKVTLGTFTDSSGIIFRNFTVQTASLIYTSSAYVKDGTCRYVGISWGMRSSGGVGCYFDLQTGTLTQARNNGYPFSITPAGNGWYRISVTSINAPGGAGQFMAIIPLTVPIPTNGPSNNIEPLYNGNGEYLYTTGWQHELGSFPTSFIPTTASTVTRQPDQLVLNKTLNPQGAFYIESSTTTTHLVADNGSSSLIPPQGTKSALYYNTSRTLSMSSSTQPVEGNYNIPQNLNRVSLGFNRLNNSNYINGHLKKFMYYGSPVTEDNLRSLTGNTRSTFREQIVTDGLVLNLDAGNPASYPGSGTTWSDLSGNGNNGTLLNGVGYSGDNLGSLVFDGVDDFVNTEYFLPNTNYTISSIFNFKGSLTSQSNRGLFSTFSTGNFNGIYMGTRGESSTASSNMWLFTNGNSNYAIPYIFEVNKWYQVVFVITSSTIAIYINSTFLSQINRTTTHQAVLNIGRTRFNSNYWIGNIAQFSVYNKELSAAEIQQNFIATRSRFGI